MGFDTVDGWLPDPDGCLDQFTMTACACSGAGSQNSQLLGAGNEGGQKQLRTPMRGV